MGTAFGERLINWTSEDSCPPERGDVVEVDSGYLERGMDFRGLR